MKRLFLRLWLVVGASFLITLLLINVIFDRIYLPFQQRVFAEQVRGQLYALRQGLDGKDSAAQQNQLAQWQPHYGIALALLPSAPALEAGEQEQLRRNGLISRQKFEIVLAPLDPLHPDGPWLRLHLPGEPSMTLYLTLIAYSVMLALFGLCLYAWVRLLWRDLDALRVHADRIGAGDLQARAQVSPRSQIRVIVDHSNRMAARVAFCLDLMQDSDDRDRRARLAQGLHGDLAELNRLVSELLAYERLEHPSDGEPLQRIEANDWLQDCLADARRDAERTGLVVRVQPSALPRVDAEPRLLQLALSNLVGNALRHAHSQVEVSLVGVGGRACLRVDDDGPGIAEADHEKVMRPFTRLDDSRSRDTGGFGLGLAIVNRIAARHGGELRISRATLGGARLEMHWPLAAS